MRHILRNPTFAGKVAWNRVKHYRPGAHGKDKHHVVYTPEDEWIMVDGAHEAIIPYEKWLEVQHRRKEKYIRRIIPASAPPIRRAYRMLGVRP